MSIGDEDEDDILESETSEGTEGSDPTGGDEGTEVSAEHAGAEADDGQPQDEVEDRGGQPPPKTSRGERRFQTLANELKAEREARQRVERERDEERRRAWQRDQQVNEQTERERMALMTPEERTEYRIEKMQRQTNEQLRSASMQTAMQMDKTAYDAKATINPIYAKYRDEVEAKFAEQLSKGQPVEREILLENILGKRAIAAAMNSGGQRRQAKRRVDAQRVPAGSSKGDTESRRERAGNTPESRLKDVFI